MIDAVKVILLCMEDYIGKFLVVFKISQAKCCCSLFGIVCSEKVTCALSAAMQGMQ